MKSVTPALLAHLAQTVTTLATCWLIQRTDGALFGFTTFDNDLTVSGQLFRSTTGFSRTAMTTGSTGEVDNVDVVGFFDPTGVTAMDVKNGLYNYASVFLFAVNWADLSQGILRLRRGWLGEVVRSQSGLFQAELRGLTQALTQEFGNIFMPICRADLGDAKCTIPIAPVAWQPNTTYAAGTYVSPLTKTNDNLRIAIFKANNTGLSGTTEPIWDGTIGAIIPDSGLTWLSIRPYRLIGTVAAPLDAHSFVANPLSFPANSLNNTATISIRNNVTPGTSLEFNDGEFTVVVNFPFVVPAATAHGNILSQLAAGPTAIVVTSDTGTYNIGLTNTNGLQANIVKTGDAALPSAFVIVNFTAAYLDGGTITWISGNNAGVSTEMKTYDTDTSIVTTWLGLNYAPQPGDRFYYYPGCDKTRETCYNKFSNILNFRGEPDIPGLDAALAYPEV